MTDRQPRPVGDPVRAFRTALRRAHKAEAELRRVKAENARLRAVQQQGDGQ